MQLLGSSIPSGVRISDKMSSRTQKARLGVIDLRHLWRPRDLALSIAGQVYTAQ